jgi:hypothetical protein
MGQVAIAIVVAHADATRNGLTIQKTLAISATSASS